MPEKIKILHVTKKQSDAGLMNQVLKKAEIDFIALPVFTKEDFVKALNEFYPDIILADHLYSSFNTHEALELLHGSGMQIPFVIITSEMSDEFTEDIIKRGADDYIFKDRLNVLPFAIKKSLEKFRIEKERITVLNELTKNKERYHALVENANDAVVIFNLAGRPIYVSDSIQRVLGYSKDYAMQLGAYELLHPEDRRGLSKKMAECLYKPGIPLEGYTCRIKHQDGTWHWIEATLTNMLNHPAINGIVDNFRDVTVRKEAEEKLINNENKFRGLVENGAGMAILSPEGKPLYVSESLINVLGYNHEEGMQLDLITMSHPDDISSMSSILKQAMDKPGVPIKGGATRVRHKDGNWRWIDGVLKNMVQNPAIGGIIDNFRDVTELKQAEEKINQLNRLYAFTSHINKAIVHSQEVLAVFRNACNIATEIGKFKAAWIGMIDSKNQIINMVEGSGILTEDLPRFTNIFYVDNGPQYHVLHTDSYFICNNISKDLHLTAWKPLAAKRGYGSCMVLPLRKSGNIIATFNLYASELNFFTSEEIALLVEATDDISFAIDVFEKQDQKLQADELLKHKELHLNQAQAIAHVGSWELTFSSGVLTWSDEALRIHGLTQEQSHQSYESWLSFIHPDDLERVLRITRQAELTLSNSSFAHRIVRKDGTIRHVYSQAHFEFGSDGNPTGLYGITHDITQIKEAEAELYKSESNLKAIFENSSEGFILADTAGIVKAFNKKSKDIILLNTEKEINVGDSIFEFIHESRKGNYRDAISKVLAGETLQYDFLYERKNGDAKWYSFTINPVYNSGMIEGISIASNDITERKKTEELLLDSQSNLKAIIENTDATIYSLNKDLRYITFNPRHQIAMKEIYGMDIKPGDNVFDFLYKFQPEEANAWKQMYQKALKGKTIKFEKEFNFNTIYSCISFSIHPIWQDQQVIGLSCFTQDITKQKQTSNALHESEFRYRHIVETAQEGIWLIDENNGTTFVNNKLSEILEYSKEEMLGKEIYFFMDDEGKRIATKLMEDKKKGKSGHSDFKYISKNGKPVWANVSANPIFDDQRIYKGSLAMITDITEKKKLEKLLDKANHMAMIGSYEADLVHNTLYWSDITKEIFEAGSDFSPNLETSINFFKPGAMREALLNASHELMEKGTPLNLELQIVTARGNERWIRIMGESEFKDGKCIKFTGSFQDIDARKRAEIEVLTVYREKNNILESIQDGFYALDKNWIVTYWNKEAESLLNRKRENILGKEFWKEFPEEVNTLFFTFYHRAIKENKSFQFEACYETLNIWVEVSVYPSGDGLSVYFRNITERKIYELQLKKLNRDLLDHTRELAVSNKELEQFAYVTSHDLQEPLRMVTSFLTLLEKKYGHIIDDKGKTYIHFAVDGAKRMRQVILDLLEFSKVGKPNDNDFEEVDLNELLQDIILTYRKQIEETGATIRFDHLPSVRNHKTPLQQLFKNLIGNALNYRKMGILPVVKISYRQNADHLLFAVEDNGIGIEREYFEKIFIMFQRLHNKEDYAGTGIGLAICKKIVDNMRGRIWVESELGKGSTFYFTIPIKNELPPQ